MLTCDQCLKGSHWKCRGKTCANYKGRNLRHAQGKYNPGRKPKTPKLVQSPHLAEDSTVVLTKQMCAAIVDDDRCADFIDLHLGGRQSPNHRQIERVRREASRSEDRTFSKEST